MTPQTHVSAHSASVRCYPSLPIAFLAWCGIDFSAGLDWLRDRGKSTATACRTSNLSRLLGSVFRRALFHRNLSKQTVDRSMFGRRLFLFGPGNVRCLQPIRSLRISNQSRSLSLMRAMQVKAPVILRARNGLGCDRPAQPRVGDLQKLARKACPARANSAARPPYVRQNLNERRNMMGTVALPGPTRN